jgi:hypothetical protein
MRAAILSAVVSAVLLLVVAPGTASADAVLTGRVTDLLGQPVAGARVHVLVGTEKETVTTDKDGNYRVVVDGNREVSVVIGAGTLHTFRRGMLKDGTVERLDFEVEVAEGEVIRIIDEKPPTVPPRLPEDTPRVTPPYSEEAVVRDAWAKAWLLLDIDETGQVLRVKLVKRPGFGLDEIAVKEAMKLRFRPALDEHGKPMRTKMFWAMEWPSHGWLVEHNGTATRMPVEAYSLDPLMRGFGGLSGLKAPPTEASALHRVRCAGTGPLNLDYRYPVYRDCSRPNLKKVPHLPWLDGTGPIPPDPPSIAPKPEPPLRLTRASYVPQFTMGGATAALLAGTLYAYVRFEEFSGRVTAATGPGRPVLDREQYVHDARGRTRWQRLAVLGTVTTIASGSITALLWFRHQRRSEFSVQPEDDGGASVRFSRSF